MNKRYILIFFFCVFSTLSCTNKLKLPSGNLEKFNSKNDEFSVTQLNHPFIPNSGLCVIEDSIKLKNNSKLIHTKDIPIEYFSNCLTKQALDYFSKNIESISFYSDSAGFISLSHPPSEVYAKEIGLDIKGNVGGTDIFAFRKTNSKLLLQNLGSPINSEFWDSQPVCLLNENGILLLIWSSDRYNNNIFSGKPFSNYGNSDLYYSFYENGIWSEVKTFSELDYKINLPVSNELTPYISCLCPNTVLFFASNRENNYDIYKANIKINYINKEIEVLSPAESLQYPINSEYNEFFPFLRFPNPDNKIYFSSDRYNKKKKIEKRTYWKNIGKYDLYEMPIQSDCIKKIIVPKIFYSVVLKDIQTQEIPKEPIFIITNFDGATRQLNSGEIVEIPNETKIQTFGGSLFESNSLINKSLMYYETQDLVKLNPLIKSRKTLQKYDTVISRTYRESLDTIFVPSELVEASVQNFKANAFNIKSVEFFEPSFRIIASKNIIAQENKTQKYRTVVTNDTIPRFTTIQNRISTTNPQQSILTKKNYIARSYQETPIYIYDTIYISPKYYKCPPCRWEFTKYNLADKRNIPFFETGMWEINTKSNLKKHLKEYSTQNFAGASFIELHPEHKEFGWKLPALSEQEEASRKVKHKQRIDEYSAYADSVDIFLNKIFSDFDKEILPEFKKALSIDPNNKLIIEVNAFSDIRPILRGWYAGDETVKYISPNYSEDRSSIEFNSEGNTIIFPGASMVGFNNDTLSRLRAYSGYKVLKQALKKNKYFMDFVYKDEVYFPDEIQLPAEGKAKLSKAKIIFIIEGKKIDVTKIPAVFDYENRINDFYILDPVRRVDYIINRVVYKKGYYTKDCCE